MEKEKLESLKQILEKTTLDLYKSSEVEAVYFVSYIIWQKFSEQELGEEGINLAYYIVLNNYNAKNQELETTIDSLKSLSELFGVNVIGIKADINAYGEKNYNRYSRKINDNSINNGVILFDKTGYISKIKNRAFFISGMVEYENKIEFDPPLSIENPQNLIKR